MQDLEDGVRVGRGRLSTISGDPGPKVQPFIDRIAMVPGQGLLDLASALSDGATLMHARLRHLEPADREAILDLMAGQLGSIVHLWTDLVRGVVASAAPATPAVAAVNRDPQHRAGVRVHPSAQTRTDERVSAGADPDVRRIPRRQVPTLRRQDDTADREMWATPLRSVKAGGDEVDVDYEGDRLTRDELTGVLNRQAGFAALGRELDRCRRAGERFVLGYLNVDGLQEVNRVQGMRGGDELLRKVTAALRATLRSYDVIMRLAGDEFLFSLPGADMATAELRAHEFGVILAEEAPGGSASVGFGELRGNDTLDEIISRAETELVKSRRSRVRSR